MSRPTIRVLGENIGVGSSVAVTFATERTVALVGIVGTVSRIRAFDELTGDPVCLIDSGKHNPELWFVDVRTRIEIGPIERQEIHSIALCDGPWTSPAEMTEMGVDAGPQDCSPDARPTFQSAAY